MQITLRDVALSWGVAVLSFVAIGTASLRAAETDSWVGLGVLKGGKGYAPSPMGQVHYRDLGPRDAKVPVLLLHMTPLTMNQFGEAQPALAALGIRSIAVDTPGYGLSDPPSQQQPDIADFADNLIAVLDHLKLKKVVVAGHHTGASIATSFAVRHPDRVAAIILHGVPIFNEEEIDVRLKRGGLGDRTPKADGSHLSRFFRPSADGRAPSAEYLRAQTWFTIDYFLQGPDIGHNAVYRYAMVEDLKQIKVPGLILTDRGDAIHPVDQRAAKLRPDFTYQEFSDDSTLSIMMHPVAWAKVVADYVKKTVK